MDQAPQQPSSPQSFEVKNNRILQFQTASNIGTLGNIVTLDNTGARHIQTHCSAHVTEVRRGRKIRNGAAYLVQAKISAVQTLKAVSFVGFVRVSPLDINKTDPEISHTIRWKAC
eukprot:3531986-Pleurochrysis_carterae.AAC.1